MVDRRKAILVNEYEEATDAALQDAASRSGARVMPKVRVADALNIENSGITSAEYSYALKAHFDFVVSRENEPPEFAVEFDGPNHDRDLTVIMNDNLKQSVCKKLGMPLLRIDSGYLRRVGRFTLVGWLAEVWFLSEAFYAAQERGEIPLDEPFLWSSILEYDSERKRLLHPYDPFSSSRVRIIKWFEQQVCTEVTPKRLEGLDPTGYHVSVAYLTAKNGDVITGVAKCKDFKFREVSPRELAEELSVVDVAEKFQLYLDGEYSLPDFDEVAAWKQRIAKWTLRDGIEIQ